MKNPLKKLWRKIQNFHSHPLTRATEELKKAAQAHCRILSDINYHQMLLEFYNNQAFSLSPHEHWWEFAAAKDSAKHHAEELAAERHLEEEARAHLNACRERLRMVREGIEE